MFLTWSPKLIFTNEKKNLRFLLYSMLILGQNLGQNLAFQGPLSFKFHNQIDINLQYFPFTYTRSFTAKVKFRYSEKATKFEKIFHIKFDITEQHQILRRRFFKILWPSQNIRTLLNSLLFKYIYCARRLIKKEMVCNFPLMS